MDVTVYLPDEIGQRAKDAGLNLSRMLRDAVVKEFERRQATAKLGQDATLYTIHAESHRGVAETHRIRGTHLAEGRNCDVYVTTDGQVVVHYHNTNTVDALDEPAEELRELLDEKGYREAVTAIGLRPIIDWGGER